MDWLVILTIIFLSLIALLLSGLPVAFAFLVINVVGSFLLQGGYSGINQFVLGMYASVTSFSLVPVPLFVLMGTLLFKCRIAERMLDVMNKLLGAIPGRLSLLTGLAGVVFGALSGSNMANTALLGSSLAPEMQKKNYKPPMIVGPILASGGLAMIIPPSTLAVVYASIARISVAELLMAGIGPGIVMGTYYCLYIVIRCYKNPDLAPVYEVEDIDWREKLVSLAKVVLPAAFLILMVIGTILLGVATPSEAAGFGVLGALILSVIYRELTYQRFKESIHETLRISGMIFLIIAGSTCFSQLLSFSGASRGLVSFVVALDVPDGLLLFLMLLLIVIMGTFMEQLAIMMIAIPLYMPVLGALGVDPVWFAVLFLISLQIGLTTPPFGLNLFVLKGVLPKEIKLKEMYTAAFPFIGCDVLSIITITLVPGIVTLFYGG